MSDFGLPGFTDDQAVHAALGTAGWMLLKG